MGISRKKRPLERSEQILRDARLVVIATEGSCTEKLYFDNFCDSRVQVRVIPSHGGRSAPEHILSNLNKFAEHYQIGAGDTLWIVIDFDRWKIKTLTQIASECVQKNYGLAVSNPCFELWFALHFDRPLPTPLTARTLVAHLKNCMGSYNKNNFSIEALLPHTDKAIKRAQVSDINVDDRWPNAEGTRVYRVLNDIKNL